MGRIYTVPFASANVGATRDLFEFVAAAGKPCRLRALEMDQTTELMDAADEWLQIIFKSGQTTTGSGGSAVTPVPIDPDDVAAGFTAAVNNSTKASGGTIVTRANAAWNVRSGLIWMLPPELCPKISGGMRFTIEMPSTPLDTITMFGTAWVEEL